MSFQDRVRLAHHYDTWSAKTTLTTVSDSHSLLSGMRALDIANALDGYDMFSVNADDGCKAGVDRGMVYLPSSRIDLRDDLYIYCQR
jgi:hypothetical protein